ncbi:DC1 [Dillenia turbinata]|uniref:DC1 n=1 Tax=Dillenia turbinata TaxID=194707 RepID=A0AAN8VAB7_9MAGN
MAGIDSHGQQVQEIPVHRHFGHQHPLEFTNFHGGDQVEDTTCFGCGLQIIPGRNYYTCRGCAFSLHSFCFRMPRKIHHPADPHHILILLVTPTFRCKGCNLPGSGLSYYCRLCLKNYHMLCTSLPLSLSLHCHAHPLDLIFSPPYTEFQAFRCNICRALGSDHWLYHCNGCEFDVCLNCAKLNPTTQSQNVMSSSNQASQASTSMICSSRGQPNGNSSSATIVASGINQATIGNSNHLPRSVSSHQAYSFSTRSPVFDSNNAMPSVPSVGQASNLITASQAMPVVSHVGQGNNIVASAQTMPAVSYVGQVSNMGNIATTAQAVPAVPFVGLTNNPQVMLQQPISGNNFIPASASYGAIVRPGGYVQQNTIPILAPASSHNYVHLSPTGSVSAPYQKKNGVGGAILSGASSGIGQALAQEALHSAFGGGDGLGSSLDFDFSDTLTCWFGGPDIF